MTSDRLDRALVSRGLFASRSKAREAIEAGQVRVDGEAVLQPSAPVGAGAVIEAQAAHPWVGRGALKLDGALRLWPVPVAGRIALDVGASTGGFTEVLLSRGVLRVHAVDVGRGQLHPGLAADPRVIAHEGLDARRLDRTLVPDPIGLVVCDASFIGLAKVLPAALELAEPGADLVALVKPQFEVGPERVGKGGMVRDAAARARALTAVADWLETQGWPVQATADSPIAGAEGAREYLLWARKQGG